MSQGNLEIVEQFIASWHRRDIRGLLGYLDPEVELTTTGYGGPDLRPVYRGIDEWLEFWRMMSSLFDEFHFRDMKFRDWDDQVCVSVIARFRARRNGIEVDREGTAVFTVAGDTISRVDMFQTLEAAAEQFGRLV